MRQRRAAVVCGTYRNDPEHRPFFSGRAEASLAGVAGGRRWRASLAGVAGGRRWRSRRRSRTKTAVISITGTKTRHTHKPRKHQTAHCAATRPPPPPCAAVAAVVRARAYTRSLTSVVASRCRRHRRCRRRCRCRTLRSCLRGHKTTGAGVVSLSVKKAGSVSTCM